MAALFKLKRKPSVQVEVEEVFSNGERSTSQSLLESGAPQRPTPIKSFTHGSKRSVALERGTHLKRFWIRGIMGIFIPIAVTVYWFLVWYVYKVPDPNNKKSPVLFGHSGGLWLFYSWFLVGIFGLGLAKYGLVGLEASMLMEKRFAAKNAMQIMMHADHSWSGPSGWMKAIRDMFIRGNERPEPPTTLWSILAFLSILPFIALPLTGLCYELKEGFHTTNTHPLAIGLTWDNINFVTGAGISSDIWKTGTKANLPGLGVVYTPPDVDRSQLNYLAKFPNSLPVDDGLKDGFVTAQADVPISGNSWGLALRYNCSVVNKLSDFTILNQRDAIDAATSDADFGSWYPDTTQSTYYVRRKATAFGEAYADNFNAIMEEGTSLWPSPFNADEAEDGVSDDCYYWGHNNQNRHYPGLDEESVYEAVLWQSLNTSLVQDQRTNYNLTLDSNFTELYGTWTMNYTGVLQNMTAIGVRCTVSSAVGTADIDGRESIYTNFERSDTKIPFLDTCMPRLGNAAPAGVIEGSTALDDSGEWLSNIFRSINSPVALTANDTYYDKNNTFKDEQYIQLGYFQASDLKHALLRTYPAYVNEMMYNGGFGFSTENGTQPITFIHPNVTGFRAERLFETGTINQWIPGAMFILWTLGSVILTAMYGFRRRWSASVDGYSMFRFGADLAEKVRDRPEFGVNMSYEECYVLREIPGLIGDANVGFEPGHISLVQGGTKALAAKNKLYM